MNTQNSTPKDALVLLREASSDETKAVEYFEARRWEKSGPCCPRCGSVNVKQMVGKDGKREAHYRWRCRDCKRQYSVRTGIVFEETRLPLRVWAHAYWRCCAGKKGYAALQFKRETGISYESALFVLHRIRFGMADLAAADKLAGVIEADSTFVGGKVRRRNNQTEPLSTGRRTGKMASVLAAVERGGKVRARHVASVTSENVREFLTAHASTDARLMTDEAHQFVKIGRQFKGGHDKIHHKRYEYARGDVTTNTIEGFFGILKRGLSGVYHSVSHEHLHRYLAEFEFRYNARKMTDDQRVALAIKASEGKRLTYREPASEAA